MLNDKKKLLEMIYNKQISAEEAFKLYKNAQQGVFSEEPVKEVKSVNLNEKSENIASSVSQPFRETCRDIAVIGVAGQFPDAQNIEEFWHNLSTGKDSINEVPKLRWDLEKIDEPVRKYCTLGGYLSDPDLFDPMFFGISPKEAEYMDPRQRLMLQEVWKAIEDAGYSTKDLEGAKCGVFIGCQQGDYVQRFNKKENALLVTGTNNAILTGRISYLLNLKGPSYAVDTACSASLVAIVLACESIRCGTSEMAIAGGVACVTTPHIYIGLGKSSMLAPDGRCKTFDGRADGFVPGEGVGAIILKSLEAAERDGDQIYGVIKGTGMNQDGKTNGITAPSGPAQTAVEAEVYERFNINPGNISYIEAHGTGTKLGDPIEVEALTDSFGKFTSKKQFCAIGSVKTNIGHALPAAGIASAIKTLLCLKHKKLVPSLNMIKENEFINFENSPFYVSTKYQDWNTENGMPRMAAISSFGFSGTNAHVVVSEPERRNDEQHSVKSRPWNIIPLSAKNEAALRRKLVDLSAWLEREGEEHAFENIAYTLMVGRVHFASRAIFIARNAGELKKLINEVLNGKKPENYLVNNPKDGKPVVSPALKQFGQQTINELRTNGITANEFKDKLLALADLYIKGYDLEWKKLYQDSKYYRISLPVYPFARERYWIPEGEEAEIIDVKICKVEKLHPLIDKNISSLKGQKFVTQISDEYTYLSGKTVSGMKVLPASSCIEIARAAGELAGEGEVRKIKDIVYSRPITLKDNTQEIHVSLLQDNDTVAYEISVPVGSKKKAIYSQGKLFYQDQVAQNKNEYLNIDAIEENCVEQKTGTECYKIFKEQGLQYLPGYNVIQKLCTNKSEAISRLTLPIEAFNERKEFILHPALMEGAVQTALSLIGGSIKASDIYEVDEIEIIRPLTGICYAYVKFSNGFESNTMIKGFDIALADESGLVLARMKNVKLAVVELKQQVSDASDSMHYIVEKAWKEAKDSRSTIQNLAGTIIVLTNDKSQKAPSEIFKGMNGLKVVCVQNNSYFEKKSDGEYFVDFTKADQGTQTASRILENDDKIVGCIDLSDLHSDSTDKCLGTIGKITLLQNLIKNTNHKPFYVLHLTRGLVTFDAKEVTLAGADFAGLARMLSAEYSRVQSRTVDIDLSVDDISGIKDIVLKEMGTQDLAGEVCYRKGKRYISYMKEIFSQEKNQMDYSLTTLIPDPQKVIVITGGTRGIGAAIAKNLVLKGARKLVLMGAQPIPSRDQWEMILKDTNASKGVISKIKMVMELEEKGTKIEIYTGTLTNKERLQEFFEGVRQKLGEISGVIHCAGLNLDRNPAFINKTVEDIQSILEPKIEGLQVLHEVFGRDSLNYFILFSSVASVATVLATGISDYAIANAFMDYFAAYQNVKGNTHYKSVAWPTWKDVGMGEGMGAFISPAYRQLGLDAHSAAEGIVMLDNSMKFWQNVCIMPCLAFEEKFKPEILLQVKLEKKQQQENRVISVPVASSTNTDSDIIQKLKNIFAAELKIPESEMDIETQFGDYGVDSIMLTELVKKVEAKLNKKLDPAIFLEYPTIKSLSQYLTQGSNIQSEKPVVEEFSTKQEVAVEKAVNSNISQILIEIFAKELKIPESEIDKDSQFGDFGVDSIMLTELVKKVEDKLTSKLDPAIFLEYPTISSLSKYLEQNVSSEQKVVVSINNHSESKPLAEGSDLSLQFAVSTPRELISITNSKPKAVETLKVTQEASVKVVQESEIRKIAVIGVACHFPDAKNKDEFWSNLVNGRNSISEIPPSRWDKNKLYSPQYQKGKSYSKWGGFIEGIEEFDPAYFNLSEEEALHMDPMMRQFMEVSVQTLRDAGYDKKELWNKRVGVFVGARAGNFENRVEEPMKSSIIGIGQNFVAAHISHFFNFKGPNLVVDTACSSTLVAINIACNSIMTKESDLALVGGVNILLDERPYMILSEGRALSPDGKCHTFDEKANGFVPGEGCGAVLLKPLDKAIEDGDQIYAVIDSTALNNDGHTMGITTPNPEAQEEVIQIALNKGKINANSVSYIEAHGTGTMIGDPIELKALTRVFRQFTDEKQFCAVGSVKTNFGHLLSGAGIASFIKVVLSIQHKQIPPSINCNTPNPRFEFSSSPFYPNTELKEWKQKEGTRRAGISSFGFGGTNAHIIVSECDQNLIKKYSKIRNPLPPVVFNKKRYWLEKKETQGQALNNVYTPVKEINEPAKKSDVNGFASLMMLEKEA